MSFWLFKDIANINIFFGCPSSFSSLEKGDNQQASIDRVKKSLTNKRNNQYK
jgi:hypothetical protein